MKKTTAAAFAAAWLLAGAAAPAQELPPQEVHRQGFVPVADELFALVTEFYAYDEALPLDERVVDRWQEESGRYENLVFTTSSGERVPGDLVLPSAGAPPFPAVLLVHGLNSDRDYWWRPDREELPAALLATGVAVMTIDLRFHGARAAVNDFLPPAAMTMNGNELFVRSRDMTIQSAIDCRRALDLLRARPEIDAGRLAVAGYSMGGMIALYLAALEEGLAAVVAAAVPTRPQGLPTDHFNFAARAMAPVLLQMGSSDWLSSPADAVTLERLVPRGRASLKLYDAGHRLPPAFAADAAAWLSERLRPAP